MKYAYTNKVILGLSDLSAAFDTVGHYNLIKRIPTCSLHAGSPKGLGKVCRVAGREKVTPLISTTQRA